MGRHWTALIQERLVRLPQENLALKQGKVARATELRATVFTGHPRSPLPVCYNHHSALGMFVLQLQKTVSELEKTKEELKSTQKDLKNADKEILVRIAFLSLQ